MGRDQLFRSALPGRPLAGVTLLLALAAGGCGDGPASDGPDFATEGSAGSASDNLDPSQADQSASLPTSVGAPANAGIPTSGGASASGAAGIAPATGVVDVNESGGDMGDNGDSTATGSEVAAPATGSGPGDWSAGDYPEGPGMETYLQLEGLPDQGGIARQYKVHVPTGYDANQPTPLVYCLHGLSQTPVLFCVNGSKLIETSDKEGFILVMPVGVGNSWNAGSCCGDAANRGLDEVGFMRAIFEEVSSHLNIDPDRVYATGLSNGGFMSYRLGCEASDLFAAVAPNAGLIGTPGVFGTNAATSDFAACNPSRPIPIFDTHGDADGIVPFASKRATLETARVANGCSPNTHPAEAPMSSGDTTCITYEGCKDDAELTACSVAGGGHCWFGSDDCGTGGGAIGMAFVGSNSTTLDNNQAVWEFFKRNPMTH